jgi:hypothetical protein
MAKDEFGTRPFVSKFVKIRLTNFVDEFLVNWYALAPSDSYVRICMYVRAVRTLAYEQTQNSTLYIQAPFCVRGETIL